LLVADAIGRILMVLMGLYPIGVGYQTFGIITGTSIVIFLCNLHWSQIKGLRVRTRSTKIQTYTLPFWRDVFAGKSGIKKIKMKDKYKYGIGFWSAAAFTA